MAAHVTFSCCADLQHSLTRPSFAPSDGGLLARKFEHNTVILHHRSSHLHMTLAISTQSVSDLACLKQASRQPFTVVTAAQQAPRLP
jgi:hypothetical protein